MLASCRDRRDGMLSFFKKINAEYLNGRRMPTSRRPKQSVMASCTEDLVAEAEAWALGNGVIMRDATGAANHAPFSLLPFRVPRAAFANLTALCPLFNTLIDRYSRDYDFIVQSLNNVVKVDEFTRRLVDIYHTIHAEGIAQPIYMGVHRSDYLLHRPTSSNSAAHAEGRFLQVEVNTISRYDRILYPRGKSWTPPYFLRLCFPDSAFAGLSTKLSALHKYLLERHTPAADLLPGNLPANEPVVVIARALAQAVTLHGGKE